MALVVDAMDLLHAGAIDAFAIVSSDADFTPLAKRILSDAVQVYGFGQNKTPKPFVNACTQFFYIEAARSTKLLRGRRLSQRLRNAVDAASGDDGWAHLSQVRNQLGNRSSFDPRSYGHRKLVSLMEASDLFEVRRINLVVHVRNKGAT